MTELAHSSLRRRHDIAESITLPLTDPFVITEDEGLTLFDRASASDPELVAVKWRQSGIEEVSCIQDLIAHEKVSISMELVGPRLRNAVDDPTRGTTILRRIVTDQD